MIKIRDFIDVKVLQNIQDQFSEATGLAAIAVDADGSYLTKGSNFTDFCMKYTRGCEEGLRRCVKCDNECKGTYFCHAGLMDFASDIIVEGERVGAIIGGQVLPSEPDFDSFRSIARELGIHEDAYIDALKKVPIRPEKTIRAASAMLGDIVNRLVNFEYLKRRDEKKIQAFDTEFGKVLTAVDSIKSKMQDLHSSASMESILAVNASIEAGRAGHAGVGFAVVAREIGDLAKRSAGTYTEIQEHMKTVEQAVTKMKKAGQV